MTREIDPDDLYQDEPGRWWYEPGRHFGRPRGPNPPGPCPTWPGTYAQTARVRALTPCPLTVPQWHVEHGGHGPASPP